MPRSRTAADWITVKSAATLLGVSRHRIFLLCLHAKLAYRPIAQGIEIDARDAKRAARSLSRT